MSKVLISPSSFVESMFSLPDQELDDGILNAIKSDDLIYEKYSRKIVLLWFKNYLFELLPKIKKLATDHIDSVIEKSKNEKETYEISLDMNFDIQESKKTVLEFEFNFQPLCNNVYFFFLKSNSHAITEGEFDYTNIEENDLMQYENTIQKTFNDFTNHDNFKFYKDWEIENIPFNSRIKFMSLCQNVNNQFRIFEQKVRKHGFSYADRVWKTY
ncbi:MAG: hypothetical protein WDZ28_00010 [Simkaniaceae bacterium]